MERTAITLSQVELGSSVMNASGPRSAERGEINELAEAHNGAVVMKSCNLAGLDQPENLKNKGADYYAQIARELSGRGRVVIGSVIGTSEKEIVAVAQKLYASGAKILELNLADAYVINSVAPFSSLERLKSLIGAVRCDIGAKISIKLPPTGLNFSPRAVAEAMKSAGVWILVCANDLPKDLDIDLKTGVIKGPERPLSQAHAYYKAGDGLLDIIATGGVNGGRDAYIAHLTGAKAVQIGSALIKEGAGALERIDRELDAMLGDNGKRSVSQVIGAAGFSG